MKARAVFTERLVVRWTGTSMRKLEKELEELLAKYGLVRSDSGYDFRTHERDMQFQARPEEEEHDEKQEDAHKEG